METAAPAAGSETNQKVSLKALSEMTGFPVEMIEGELFQGLAADQEVSLTDLRAAMLNFIDSTLIEDSK